MTLGYRVFVAVKPMRVEYSIYSKFSEGFAVAAKSTAKFIYGRVLQLEEA